MKITYRSKRRLSFEIDARTYSVEVVEFPFREGVEVRCVVDGEELRVSDRGLGLDEALRLLESEIEDRLGKGS